MVVRLPVEDLLDHRVPAVHAMVHGTDAAAAGGAGLLDDLLDAGLPHGPQGRRGDVLPCEGRWRVEGRVVDERRVCRLDHDPRPRQLRRPGRSQVDHPCPDLTDALEGLAVRDHAGGSRIGQVHCREAGIGVERVGADAGRFGDLVLQKPMDDDHVAAEQLLG